jgi:hypothetical protein
VCLCVWFCSYDHGVDGVGEAAVADPFG